MCAMVGGSRLIRLLLLLLSPPLMAAAAAAGAAAVAAAAQQSSSSVVDVVRLHSVFQGAHPEVILQITHVANGCSSGVAGGCC